MIVLEKPYVSESLLLFLEETQIPVLKNDFANEASRNYPNLNMLEDTDFINLYHNTVNPGLYTVSEYALDWVYKTFSQEKLVEQVALLKDKAAFRKACRSIYNDFYFEEISISDLFGLDISGVQLPVVLKPSVGFLSAGVYTITSLSDWEEALDDIGRNFVKRAAKFPDNVVDDTRFILESYISGREFAIDLYFKDKEPVIVNIFEHPFASEKDVSDRLYCTSKLLFDKYLSVFTKHVARLNEVLNLSNIPVHMELRVENDKIVPIEINPLRFAGLCLNELHQYISGIHPLSYYFSKTVPDYEAMWKGEENQLFSFSVFEKSEDTTDELLDIEEIKLLFSDLLEIRKVDNPNLNITAFVFSKTELSNKTEIDTILNFDVKHVIEYN